MLKFLEQHKASLVYLPLILYWIILLTATSVPSDKLPKEIFEVGDKLLHFGAYLVLSVLLCLTLIFQKKFVLLKKYPYYFTILFGSLYGALDELHQMFIPGRSAEFADWVADTLGTIGGVLIVYFVKKITEK